MQKIIPAGKATQVPAEDVSTISSYTTDLTALVKEGKLDPIIGRDEQLHNIMQVLARRDLNNPLLIGEPGVGKTALIHGLAHKIISGSVPQNLKDCRLLSLNISALIAGAEFKGALEQRMEGILKEVVESGNIVLFIDDFGGIMKIESNIGLINMIKTALSDRDIRMILASGIDDYTGKIEPDKMLSGKLQMMMLEEPSIDDTYSILLGVKEKYEAHHGIRIPETVLLSAVKLARRYQPSVSAPRGPISLIDNTGSRLCIALSVMPPALQKKEAELRGLQVAKKKDQKAIDKLKQVVEAEKTTWESEKALVASRGNLLNKIESIEDLISRETAKANYDRVGELTHGSLRELKVQLSELDAKMGTSKYVHDVMTVDDVASTIAAVTGIPVSRMLGDERARLLKMEEEMGAQVISQKQAIKAICAAVRTARAGLQSETKPVFSGLFLGTTGVGKTEVAKALARILFGDENAMLRIDMSEYAEKHNVARLYGPPPGYKGYEEGGQMTGFVRRKPYCVILLDEIEKAHPDVFDALLQVLDDARLTDGQGRVVRFNNSIILMTSNIGAHHIKDQVTDEVRSAIMGDLSRRFKPELLNRLDEKIVFERLTLIDVKEIAKLAIKGVSKLLAEQNMKLSITAEALEFVTKAGFDPSNGARPLARAVNSLLKNPISDLILQDKFKSGDTIEVSLAGTEDKHLNFRKAT